MARIRVAALLVLVCLVGVRSSFAQTVSATTGAIIGKVVDNSGAVMPGVTVTISSPALMGTRNTVSGEDGQYRFVAIPPGEYRVVFELVGFSNMIREGIRVQGGFTATVNVEMALASLTESVTVTGESPVVDTQSTRINNTFDAATLANLPTGSRDMWALLAESPGVSMSRIDVGGSAALTQVGYIVYGTTGQNRPMVEGMVATEASGSMYYTDYGSFQEISIGTGANTAEMPNPGVMAQFISKSGGNQYHSTLYFDYENQNIQSRNIDANQISRGLTGGGNLGPTDLNRLTSYKDFNGDLGGFIVKDKLWWYGSIRYSTTEAQKTNFPVQPQFTKVTATSVKGTYNLNQNNKLIGYFQRISKVQPDRLDAYLLGPTVAVNTSHETTWNEVFPAGVWKGEYNKVFNDRVFGEIRAGGYFFDFYNYTNAPDKTRFEDLGNNNVYGGNRTNLTARRRPQVLGSVSYFKDGWAGTHNFKFGGELLHETLRNVEDGFPQNILQVLRNGAPIEVYQFQPGESINGLQTTSMYANDSWRVSNKLTLNIGLRFDRFRSFLPDQQHPASTYNPTAQSFGAVDDVVHWNQWAPRAGFSYDVSGNGKSVVKVNYGIYWWNPAADFTGTVNPNAPLWYRRYAWTDTNSNGKWDQGEQGRLIASAGGAGSAALDPNLKDTYTREFAGWFEHELARNFGLRTGFIWRTEKQHRQQTNANQPFSAFTVPVSIPDPGPDGVVGNADDGKAIAGYNLAPAYVGLTPTNVVLNPANANTDYYTWETTANRRMTSHWSLMATFAETWSRDQNSTYQGNAVRANVYPVTPNDLINTVDGRFQFNTWQGKLESTIEFPHDFKVTPILRHQAGQPFVRTFLATLNYGSVRIVSAPLDTGRNDNVTLFDVRAEKGLKFSGRRAAFFFDLYNTFNANPEETRTASSGSAYLRPLTVVAPRIGRFGVKFEW